MTDFRPDLREVYRQPVNPPEIEKAVAEGMRELSKLERKAQPAPHDPSMPGAVRSTALFFIGLAAIGWSVASGDPEPTVLTLGAALMGLPAFLVAPPVDNTASDQ